jgi:hypothetical protein
MNNAATPPVTPAATLDHHTHRGVPTLEELRSSVITVTILDHERSAPPLQSYKGARSLFERCNQQTAPPSQ